MRHNTTRVGVVIGAPFLVLILPIMLLLGGVNTRHFEARKTAGIDLEVNAAAVPKWAARAIGMAAGTCPEVTSPILAAQIDAESAWNPRAISPDGARGLAQFMPATWANWGLDGDGDGRADPFNPSDAIASQAAYMCYLVDFVKEEPGFTGSVLELALAAYNAGPGNVQHYKGIPPFGETTVYVAKVLKLATTVYGRPRHVDGATGLVIAAARSQLGLPYAWGGGTLNGPSGGSAPDIGIVGFDCSSLVRYAFHQGTNGKIALPRTSREQYAATQHRRIPVAQLKPGDLLFWGTTPATVHHVALYIGAGRMIEAPQSGQIIRETHARIRDGDFLAATRPMNRAQL